MGAIEPPPELQFERMLAMLPVAERAQLADWFYRASALMGELRDVVFPAEPEEETEEVLQAPWASHIPYFVRRQASISPTAYGQWLPGRIEDPPGHDARLRRSDHPRSCLPTVGSAIDAVFPRTLPAGHP